MTKQGEIKLPKGYKWVVDNQSADQTTIAVILPNGDIEYKRVAINDD